ncbi:MAG: DeoR/GlpR transcriptional regulator [Chitinophagaceae bacterium]|nr:DeoR/GlpR transcriptional regulator [Chitinophagaceae bacterium]
MEKGQGKSTVGRRIKIIESLKLNGQVNVAELSESLGVTVVTVRNDLKQLEKKGVLIRARGGAIKVGQSSSDEDYPLSDKQKKHLVEKIEIGKKAAELIEDSNTIIIDSGSTTFELAKNLKKFRDLTVITNALNVATLLAEYSNVNVIVPGGMLKKNSMSLVGMLAEKGFNDYFCDKLFLGVDGFDLGFGISTPNPEEAHLNQVMIEISKEVIVVADSSKFQKRGFAFIAPVNKIHTVVTDKGITAENKLKLEGMGVKVVIA